MLSDLSDGAEGLPEPDLGGYLFRQRDALSHSVS